MSNRNRGELTEREAAQMMRELGMTPDSIGVDEYGDAADEDHVGVGGTGQVEIHDRPAHILDFGGANMQIVDEQVDNKPFKDDWDHMVEQRERAKVGPNGEHLGDFDQLYQLPGAQAQALQEQAPFARTNVPPSVVGQILGGQASLAVDPVALKDVETEVCAWQGADDAETSPVTVLFGPVGAAYTFNQGPNTLPLRPYGLVKFGTRGFLLEAKVDIGQGCQLTVPGSQVRVTVGLEAPATVPGGTVSPPVTLTGMLSFLVTQRQKPITRTIYVDNLGPGADQIVTVPNFAKDLIVIRDHDNTIVCHVNFMNSRGTNVYRFDLASGFFQTVPVILTGEVAQVDIVNDDGAITANFRLVFGLEF
jgi:hypothetical protein